MNYLPYNKENIFYIVSIGYTVKKDGTLLKNGKPTRTRAINSKGYFVLKTRDKNRKNFYVRIHRLQAYQKYGDEIFDRNIEVRHLDGNKLNNSWDNIILGTHSQNMFDVPKEVRNARTEKGASSVRKFNEEKLKEIFKDREDGMSLRKLALKYGCAKSTMSHLFNKKTYKKITGEW